MRHYKGSIGHIYASLLGHVDTYMRHYKGSLGHIYASLSGDQDTYMRQYQGTRIHICVIIRGLGYIICVNFRGSGYLYASVSGDQNTYMRHYQRQGYKHATYVIKRGLGYFHASLSVDQSLGYLHASLSVDQSLIHTCVIIRGPGYICMRQYQGSRIHISVSIKQGGGFQIKGKYYR